MEEKKKYPCRNGQGYFAVGAYAFYLCLLPLVCAVLLLCHVVIYSFGLPLITEDYRTGNGVSVPASLTAVSPTKMFCITLPDAPERPVITILVVLKSNAENFSVAPCFPNIKYPNSYKNLFFEKHYTLHKRPVYRRLQRCKPCQTLHVFV